MKDIFTTIREEFGIEKVFFAQKLGMSSQAFSYAYLHRGLTKREVEIIEQWFKIISSGMKEIKIPDSMKKKSEKWVRQADSK